MSYGEKTIAHALERGIAEPEINLPMIVDGCSGGLSWLYALGGRHISCEDCCNIHDIDYHMGGGFWDRWTADRELRQCAAKAGSFPPGIKGRTRCVWRHFRAWVMWIAVRLFGWKYWAGD